jgi:hypothetical protein
VAAGFLAFAALCTKGPAGLFVIAVPTFGRLLGGEPRRHSTSCQIGLLLGFGVALTLTLALSPGARQFPHAYWSNQFLPSLMGARELASSRFLVLGVTARELLIPLVLAIGVDVRRWVNVEEARPRTKFFTACAAAGIAPYLATPKQMEWYVAPALVFGALAIATIGEQRGREIEERFARPEPARAVRYVSIAGAILAGGLALRMSGALDVSVAVAIRDRLVRGAVDSPASEHFWRDFRRDVLGQGANIPPGSRVHAVNPTDWFRLQAHAQRYLHATLSSQDTTRFVIVDRASSYDAHAVARCAPVNREARRFVVFSCL